MRPRTFRFDPNSEPAPTFDSRGRLLSGLGDTTMTWADYQAQADPLSLAYWTSGGQGSYYVGQAIGPPVSATINTAQAAAQQVTDTAKQAVQSGEDFLQSIKDAIAGATDAAGGVFSTLTVLALLAGAVYLVSKTSKD